MLVGPAILCFKPSLTKKKATMIKTTTMIRWVVQASPTSAVRGPAGGVDEGPFKVAEEAPDSSSMFHSSSLRILPSVL